MAVVTTSAFISYSHADGSLVGPIVALLRASRVLVFRDADSIVPGKRWQAAIDDAIQNSTLLVLFWCRHASNSKEVLKEYRAAMRCGKDVLPLLLDDTPLPDALRQFQHIDFRRMGLELHEQQERPMRRVQGKRVDQARLKKLPVLMTLVGLASLVATALVTDSGWLRWLLLVGVSVVLAGVILKGLLFQKMSSSPRERGAVGKPASTGAEQSPKTAFQHDVAEVVSAEVLRRTAQGPRSIV